MLMKNPPHPGRIVKREIEALRLTITEAAAALGVSRQALNNLVNEKGGISAEMAIRLSKALGSTPDTWVKLPDGVDTMKLYDSALAKGVAINPGQQWSVNKEHSRSRLRRCFGSSSHEEIHQGIAALAEVCRRDFGVSTLSK